MPDPMNPSQDGPQNAQVVPAAPLPADPAAAPEPPAAAENAPAAHGTPAAPVPIQPLAVPIAANGGGAGAGAPPDGGAGGDGHADPPEPVQPQNLNLSEVRVADLSDSSVTAAPLPPITQVGFMLAKYVLIIMAGVIVVMTFYLFTMDRNTGSQISEIYKNVLNPSKVGTELYTLVALNRLMADVSEQAKDKTAKLSDGAADNAADVIKLLSRAHGISSRALAIIKTCGHLPEDDTRTEAAQSCVSTLQSIQDAAQDAVSGLNEAQIAADYASKVNDERQSLHSFWLQAAQLLLLNLLLPLLTGLFGYIFGTQHNNGTAPK